MDVESFLEDSDLDSAPEKASCLKKQSKASKSVRFAPGTKEANDNKPSTIRNHSIINPSQPLYPLDDESIIIKNIQKKKPLPETEPIPNSLNFIEYQFGSTASCSETSDDEKNFETLTKKYQSWSPQFAKQQQTEQEKKIKLTQRQQQLEQSKKMLDILKKKRGDFTNKNTILSKQPKIKGMNMDEYKMWKKRQNKKGVIYLSNIPFGSTSDQLRKIFSEFGRVTNVYLEVSKNENGKEKKIHGKWNNYCEGWIEFEDKNIAKMIVKLINGSKIPKKYVRNKLAKNHVWNMKYLRGFKWHHLNEYRKTITQLQRKKFDLAVNEAHRQTEYFKLQLKKANQLKNKVNQKEEENRLEQGTDDEMFNVRPVKKQKLTNQKKANVRQFKPKFARSAIRSIWKRKV